MKGGRKEGRKDYMKEGRKAGRSISSLAAGTSIYIYIYI
jgi:hypothetical protein